MFIFRCIRKKMLKTTSGVVDPSPLNSIASGDPKNSKDEEAKAALKNSKDEEASTLKNSKDEEAESTLANSKDEEAVLTLAYLKDEGASTESSLDKIPKEKLQRFTPQDLEVFTRNNAERLGGGGFGVVYKGEFPDGMPFAVKILNKDLGERTEDQFIAEVSTLSRTNHVNLVTLHGYCSDPNVKALVYEYMDNGSLDRYLYGQKAKIEWGKLYEIAVGTAEGIRYLHEECQKKIIHYDIKPANILLNKDFSPKVADFGLAEIFDRENTIFTITGGKGTPGFVAPEVWETAVLTRKSDVYSFGKVLFEMLWSTWNSEFKQAESKVRFSEWVREKVEHRELNSVIFNCGDEEDRMKTETMCKVALLCAQRDPKKRPSMSQVVEMLQAVSCPDVEEDCPLPAIGGLQISGEAFPGRKLEACGYSINGTTSCNFKWVRSLEVEDGSGNYIYGATQPNYLVTADDVDSYLAVEVQPLDVRKRKGQVAKVFANEARKITCGPEMQEYIEGTLHIGHASYQVSLSAGALDIWEHALLEIKRQGYSIKYNGPRGGGVKEKFLPATTITIAYGQPTEFTIQCASGVEYRFRTAEASGSLRDKIVLTMRLFKMRAVEKMKGRKTGLFFR